MNAALSVPESERPNNRTIALVGMMGVGKSTVGRRLATRLDMPFRDADDAIVEAAGMSVSDIFASLGESAFRDGEARIMKRLLEGPPIVLATGGGAMLNADTRARLKAHATTIWLKTDLNIIARRVARRDTRPLLRDKDPLTVLKTLAQARYPIYGEADLTVETSGGAHAEAVEAILRALTDYRARNGE